MNCELCGRPALALVRTGKKRSRKARAGQPRKIKDHSLCAGCWEKQGDSQRTSDALKGLMGTALDLWKAAEEAEREWRDAEEKRLRGIIAEARRALKAGNVARAAEVLAKEAA